MNAKILFDACRRKGTRVEPSRDSESARPNARYGWWSSIADPHCDRLRIPIHTNNHAVAHVDDSAALIVGVNLERSCECTKGVWSCQEPLTKPLRALVPSNCARLFGENNTSPLSLYSKYATTSFAGRYRLQWLVTLARSYH